jgi:hypothetical protein
MEENKKDISYNHKCIEWFDANANGKDRIWVKIARKTDGIGWENEWVDIMDSYIGAIIAIDKSSIIDNKGLCINAGGIFYAYPFECFEVIRNIKYDNVKEKTFTVRWQGSLAFDIPKREIVNAEAIHYDAVFYVATGFATREDASKFASKIEQCFGLWITETTEDPGCSMPKEALGA